MISSQGIEFNSWCGSTVERTKNLKMLNKRPFDDTVEADEKNPIEPVYYREYTAVPGQVKECRCVTEDIETF